MRPQSLPEELLDDIISNVDEPQDLLSFSLASRVCAQIIIPRHIEYRVICITGPVPNMWEHLAFRPSLAKSVRDVRFYLSDHKVPDRFPTTLVNPSNSLALSTSLPTTTEATSVKAYNDEQIRIICLALGHMECLRSFLWDRETRFPRLLNHQHQEMVLQAISKAPHLRHLTLSGQFGTQEMPCGSLIPNAPCYNPSIRGLESLSLCGESWIRKYNHSFLLDMLQRHCPTLKALNIPAELSSLLIQCHFPQLKKLVLSRTFPTSYDSKVLEFLSSHPTIENLRWTPLDRLPTPVNDILPNLQCLESDEDFMRALEAQASPSSPSSPPSNFKRSIKQLHIHRYSSHQICASPVLDPEALRRLKVDSLSSLGSYKAIAERFTGITWLSVLSPPYRGQNRTPICLDDWRDHLPLFPNLERFHSFDLWDDPNKDSMHQTITQLSQWCPKLEELGNLRLDDIELIRIFRMGADTVRGGHGERELNEEQESVRYEVWNQQLKLWSISNLESDY